jgi:hypothetical protein
MNYEKGINVLTFTNALESERRCESTNGEKNAVKHFQFHLVSNHLVARHPLSV